MEYTSKFQSLVHVGAGGGSGGTAGNSKGLAPKDKGCNRDNKIVVGGESVQNQILLLQMVLKVRTIYVLLCLVYDISEGVWTR